MIRFVVPSALDTNIREYLEVWGRGLAGRMRVLHYERLAGMDRAEPGVYILSTLDQLPAPLTALARSFAEQCERRPGFRLLNRPGTALLRYDLLAELHRQGRNHFQAVRARDPLDGLRYPVFVREENQHWASLTPLLDTPDALARGLRDLVSHGHRMGDLLVVEFCDTSDAGGFFRKYAAYAVGDEIVPRALSHGRHWSLKHRRSDFTREMVLEEQRYVLENPHEQALRDIFRIAGVGYGRIDYALLDGAVQTWEINLNPTIGRGRRPSTGIIPEELQPLRQSAKEHFYRRFQAAFEALDDGTPAGAVVQLRYPPGVLDAARNAARRGAARHLVTRAVRAVRRASRAVAARFAGSPGASPP